MADNIPDELKPMVESEVSVRLFIELFINNETLRSRVLIFYLYHLLYELVFVYCVYVFHTDCGVGKNDKGRLATLELI